MNKEMEKLMWMLKRRGYSHKFSESNYGNSSWMQLLVEKGDRMISIIARPDSYDCLQKDRKLEAWDYKDSEEAGWLNAYQALNYIQEKLA